MLTDTSSNIYGNNTECTGDGMDNIVDSLYEFLKAAELQHYFEALNIKLKVRSIAQLKYVDETDLQTIGMSRPEMRRLKKYFAKEFPQTAMGKIKKRLSRTTSCRSTSVPRPSEDSTNRMNSFSVRVNTNGQCASSPGDSDELATIASVTNFSIASNSTNDSQEWRQIGNKHIILHNQLTLAQLVNHCDMADLYKGHFRSGQVHVEVAVKIINKITLRNQFNDFLREMFTNCYLDHPNVIKLIGISLDDCTIKLVTELAPRGSMNHCLSVTDAKSEYPITVLHGFVIQISDAMSYLEERRVVHGRLTGTNVLLFSDNQVKVTDAGLFRIHESKKDTDQCSLWVSPEISKDSRETVYSDVWAFGVLLWEMYSYYHHPSLSHMDESVSSQVDMRLQYLHQPDLCPNMLYRIIQLCWTEAPKERPSFYQLSTQLIRLEPEQLVALTDGPDLVSVQRLSDDTNEPSDGSYSSLSEMQMLDYKANDTIIVLDRSMSQYKELWRGCLLSGRSGYFKWSNMRSMRANYIPKADNKQKESPEGSVKSGGCSIGETFSKIRISRREEKRKVSIDMISGPQNDFRHVGHVGVNGDVFGDVTTLYATGAQKNPSKPLASGSVHSEAVSAMSSTAMNQQHAEEHATRKRGRLKGTSDKLPKKENNITSVTQFAQPAPPLPPIRSHVEEDLNINSCLDDFSLGNNFSICNDDFSLFEELSKHWEMHSSKIESPTSDTIVGTSSLHDTSILSSSTDRESPSLNAGYSEVYDEPSLRSMSISDPVVPPKCEEINLQSNKTQRSVSLMPSSSVSAESSSVKSNIFQKLKAFGTGKPAKSKELSDGQKSPIYAKLNKALKPKKQKEVNENKKNIIGMPVIISGPVVSGNEYIDENYLDCSSEVSSLQPSPRDSTLCLANGALTDRSPSINRQTSNNAAINYRHKTSDSTNTTTSVSPASSFASLTASAPSTAVLQGGGALRALRKGDCVFRATSAVNAQNRMRPSLGDILCDGNMARTRQPNISFNGVAVKMQSSTTDGRNNFVARTDNYEDLDEILDSSATTPIASDLPDLPYIDLSFVRTNIQEKNNQGDEDDAYNSLHSGSLGSDTIEPRSVTRQSGLSSDGAAHDVNSQCTPSYRIDEASLATSATTTTNQTDVNGGRTKNNSKYTFNNSKIFAMLGDNDEVAL